MITLLFDISSEADSSQVVVSFAALTSRNDRG